MDATTITAEPVTAPFATAPEPFGTLPSAYYGAIAIDPASHFRSYTAIQSQNWASRRDNERHYRTMSFEQLAALPIHKLAAPTGCHAFIWTSGPFMPQALKLLTVWKFKYSTIVFTWVKLRRSFDPNQLRLTSLLESDLHLGLGLTSRKNSEIVLLGRRGNCRRISKSVREIILAPVREHSRKPNEFYRRVTQYCDGPYCELFARECRPGWDVWGDEVNRFGGAA